MFCQAARARRSLCEQKHRPLNFAGTADAQTLERFTRQGRERGTPPERGATRHLAAFGASEACFLPERRGRAAAFVLAPGAGPGGAAARPAAPATQVRGRRPGGAAVTRSASTSVVRVPRLVPTKRSEACAACADRVCVTATGSRAPGTTENMQRRPLLRGRHRILHGVFCPSAACEWLGTLRSSERRRWAWLPCRLCDQRMASSAGRDERPAVWRRADIRPRQVQEDQPHRKRACADHRHAG